MKPFSKKHAILITGASGFIGQKALVYFLNEGYKVHALVRSPEKLKITHPNLTVHRGSMKDADSLVQATRGVACVIHLAAAKQDEADSYETNVKGALHLAIACEKNGVARIINVSTLSTKIKNKGTYAYTKSLADAVFQERSTPVTTIKPSIVYSDLTEGMFSSLIKSARLPFTPVFGSGECTFRPIHEADFIRALEVIMNDPTTIHKTYDAVGPDIISLNALIKMLGRKVLHKKVRLVHLPEDIGYLLVFILSHIFYKPPITRSNILGSTQNVDMDKDAFFKTIKFIPRSLVKGISDVSNLEKREAKLILSYIVSQADKNINIGEREIDLYLKALQKFNIPLISVPRNAYRSPFLLGALEILSRRTKQSTILSKKLYVAAAIIECSPLSAQWLLPQERTLLQILAKSARITFSYGMKATSALFLGAMGVVKRNEL